MSPNELARPQASIGGHHESLRGPKRAYDTLDHLSEDPRRCGGPSVELLGARTTRDNQTGARNFTAFLEPAMAAFWLIANPREDPSSIRIERGG
jgi:hypothetical protein